MDPLNVFECRLALDRRTPIPLWAQIEDFLADAISDRRLEPGQLIVAEVELADRFGVSRATLRQALARLQRRGLIIRTRSGTRVAACPSAA